MAWTFVQSTSDFTAGTATLTLGSAVTSGNFLVGGGLLPTGVYIESITDDKSNHYDMVTYDDYNAGAGNGALYVVFGYRSRDVITNGPTVITFTTTSSPAGFFFKCIEEWNPPAGTTHISLDGCTNFSNYSSTVPSAASGTASSEFTTLNNNVFLWSFVWSAGSPITPTGGWSAKMTGGAGDMYTYNAVAASANNTNALEFSGGITGTMWGVAFGTAPVAQTNWVPVQQGLSPYSASSSTTIVISLPKAATVGNFIIGGFGAFTAGTISIQDNLGGTNYTVFTIAEGHAIWASNGLLTTAPTTFTITSTAAAAATVGTCAEFKPPTVATSSVVDVYGNTVYNTTPNITTLSNTLTTNQNGDLIYSWSQMVGGVPINGSNMLSNWGQKNMDAYVIQNSAGSVSSAWDFNSVGNAFVLSVAVNYTIAVPGAGAADGSSTAAAGGAYTVTVSVYNFFTTPL